MEATARKYMKQYGVKKPITLAQIVKGMRVEMEHGKRRRKTNVTNDNLEMTFKIALAHLMERPDYYTLLMKVEKKNK